MLPLRSRNRFFKPPSRLISKFVDTYLRLNATDEATFQTELGKLEPQQKEAIMYTMTSWEEKGMEKGIEKERQTIALNLLRQGFSVESITQATGLTIDQLKQLQNQL